MVEQNIFISYCWDNAKEVEEIDSFFLKNGITLTRDVRDLNYTENINEFMKKIRECDFFILVLSESYFKSINCMKELFEAFKETEFQEKVLPIVIEDNFYSNSMAIKILNYWTEKEKEESEKLKEVDPVVGYKLYKELHEIMKIKLDVVGNIKTLQGMLLTTLKSEKNNNFNTILNKIGSIQIKRNNEFDLFQDISIPNLKEITYKDKEKFLKENFIKMFNIFEQSFYKIKEKNINFNYFIYEKNNAKIIEIGVNDQSLKKMAFWLGSFYSFDDKIDSICYKILNRYETEIIKNSINGQIRCEVNNLTKELELKDCMNIYNQSNENTIEMITRNIIKNYFLNELESYSNRVRV